MSTTQYSIMPARAYNSAFAGRPKPKVESEISATRRRSAGPGLASRNSREGLASTTKSRSGLFVGLSSGATSIGASGFTNCPPKVRTNQACTATRAFTWGTFLAHLANRLSMDRFQALPIPQPRRFERGALRAGHCAAFSGILNTAASNGTFASIFSTVISIARRPFTSCVRLKGISTPSTGL